MLILPKIPIDLPYPRLHSTCRQRLFCKTALFVCFFIQVFCRRSKLCKKEKKMTKKSSSPRKYSRSSFYLFLYSEIIFSPAIYFSFSLFHLSHPQHPLSFLATTICTTHAQNKRKDPILTNNLKTLIQKSHTHTTSLQKGTQPLALPPLQIPILSQSLKIRLPIPVQRAPEVDIQNPNRPVGTRAGRPDLVRARVAHERDGLVDGPVRGRDVSADGALFLSVSALLQGE